MKKGKRRQHWIETLESRQMLSAAISVTVGSSAVSNNTVQFGPYLVGSGEQTKTFTITNSGDQEESGSVSFDTVALQTSPFSITAATNTTSSNQIPGRGSVSFDLKKGDSTSVTVGLDTSFAGTYTQDGLAIDISSDSSLSSTINLSGEVDSTSVGGYQALQIAGNGTTSESGTISASERVDSSGNVLEQVSDQLYGFHVTAQTTIGLGLSGSGADSGASGGLVATLLPDSSNGTSSQLTIQERNAAIATLTTSISGTTSTSASPTSNVLSPGYYFVLIDSSGVNQESFDNNGDPIPQTINFTLSMKTQQAAPAQIAVTGNNTGINSGDTTPTTGDGTSFGTVTAGTSEALTFTVKDTGGSALTISGSRPDVSGDFLATSVLPSSIAAGASATFAVAPSNANAGSKSGVVSISTNVGTFTFDIGGTYTAQAAPAAIAVSGNGVAIASGDTTPSTADGTSFGTVTTGTAETLTFTVKNTGGSALAITGTEPVVTGNFIATASLPSSIAAGASATFSVSPINTNMGTDSGGVSIQTSVGTYTFDVGGTYQAGSVRPQDSKLTAKVTAKKLAKAASSYAFTVVYSDSAGVDLSSLDNHDVLVTGPSGFRKWAKLISATANSDGSVTAVYHVSPPTGSWVKSLNGSYHVYIRGTVLDDGGGTASIFDADGNPDSLTVVGQFTVHISK